MIKLPWGYYKFHLNFIYGILDRNIIPIFRGFSHCNYIGDFIDF